MSDKGIIWIDMYIRDERVLSWLKERAGDQYFQVSHDAIADEFKCTRLTARAIIHRLIGAGHLQVDRSFKRGGYRYRVVSR